MKASCIPVFCMLCHVTPTRGRNAEKRGEFDPVFVLVSIEIDNKKFAFLHILQL